MIGALIGMVFGPASLIISNIIKFITKCVRSTFYTTVLPGGYCGGRFGPKRTIMASCVVATLGWLLIGLSPSVAWLVLGRVICGIGSSFSTANCSLLVAQYRYRPLPWWLRLN